MTLQVQDLVPLPEPAITPQDFTAAGHCSAAVSLLAALDMDGDGAVSRRDMLLAFRRDRQLAGKETQCWTVRLFASRFHSCAQRQPASCNRAIGVAEVECPSRCVFGCDADHLKMPARTRAGDGTFDVFLTKFISINSSGLGYVGVSELHAYLQTSGGGASLGQAPANAAPTDYVTHTVQADGSAAGEKEQGKLAAVS